MSTTQQPEGLGGKVQSLTGGSRVDLTESEKHQAMSEAMMANFIAALSPHVALGGDVPWLSMRPDNWGAQYARSRALAQLGHLESLRQPEGGPPQYRGPAVVDPRDESRANIIKQAYMDMYENAWALGEQSQREKKREIPSLYLPSLSLLLSLA